MPILQLDDEVLKNTGLDKYKTGATAYAKVKLTMGDDGVTVDSIGDVTNKSSPGNFIDAATGKPTASGAEGSPDEESGESVEEAATEDESAPNPTDGTGDESPSADVPSGESEPMNPDSTAGSEADTREEKMLGYRRPKKKQFPSPSPYEFLRDSGDH